MNYTFDDSIIHDDKAMWDLALNFKVHYNFIKEQVERSTIKRSILYKGNIVMKWDKEYKKILSDYKSELEFMNNFLEPYLKQENNKLEKYIKVD